MTHLPGDLVLAGDGGSDGGGGGGDGSGGGGGGHGWGMWVKLFRVGGSGFVDVKRGGGREGDDGSVLCGDLATWRRLRIT